MRNKPHLRIASMFTCTFLSLIPALNAADFHVSPSGNGTGITAKDPASASTISDIFNNKMSAGDRLILASGEYKEATLSLKNGGTETQPKTIEAQDGAILTSSWSIERADKGATAILLEPGLSHTVFKNISIQNYCFGVRARKATDSARVGLTFENVTIQQMRHGFYLSDCDSLTLTDCSLIRYSKHGYRLEEGCDNVIFRNCLADCSEGEAEWETKTELFPFGFNINSGGAPNTHLLFEDCVAKNNIKSNQKNNYPNGDGFSMENNTSDVTLLRCFALRNQDAGFDLKVPGVTLIDCVATHCRRAFRFWNQASLNNCFSGWTQTGVWSKTGPVNVTNSTFHALTHNSAGADNDKNLVTTLNNCLITRAEDSPKFRLKTGNSVLHNCVSEGVTFNEPVDPWDGTGSNFDSTSHPEKGYSSSRITAR